MMSDEEAPSITWEALNEEEHGKDEEEEHLPFDKRTIKRAITKGLDPSGQRLNSIMPRWEMNETELDAVTSFLKKLD